MSCLPGLVSVIIPTYNRCKLCKKAVESVLSQTYAKIEVIVVDDGSVDETKDAINNLDKRVKYVWQQNAGVSAARNRGFDAAQGEFIAFLDSDDSWLPWKLEVQINVLMKFPGAGMVWSDMIAVDENGNTLFDSYLKKMYSSYEYFDADKHFGIKGPISEVWNNCPTEWLTRKYYSGFIFPWMFMGNLVHTSTVLLRSERRAQVGLFDTTLLKSGEDYDFHFRTCRLGDVAYVDMPTIRYRVGASDQLTSKEYIQFMARNNLKTVSRMLEKARGEITLPESMVRERMATCYEWVGMAELSQDRTSARSNLGKSLGYAPFQMRVALFYLLTFLPTSFVAWLRNIKQSITLVG